MIAARDENDYASVPKKIERVNPWQCIPYVNRRDICIQGPEYETLKASILDHGIQVVINKLKFFMMMIC